MRLFLAIEIPDNIKAELENQLDLIKKEYPQYTWVPPENYHITVHFFGESQDAKTIKKKIKDLVWDKESFFLYSLEMDVFANEKLVIYLYFRREKKIEALASVIKDNFSPNSVSDRKYIPHLTLARGKRGSKQQYFALKKKLLRTEIDISLGVKSIILYESILHGSRPEYKKLAYFPLLKTTHKS